MRSEVRAAVGTPRWQSGWTGACVDARLVSGATICHLSRETNRPHLVGVRGWFAVAGLIVGIVAVSASLARADDGASADREARRIVQTTASPFCPGKTLDSCPSPKAGQWRRDIDQWAAEGVPASEIRDRLQSRVPHFDLDIPPVRWGGVIPIAALVVATLLLLFAGRPMFRRRERSASVPDEPLDESLDRRIDEELARLEW